MTAHEIGSLKDFPECKGTAVDIDGRSIAVFNFDGDLFAVQNNCPHKNLPLHPVGQEAIKSSKAETGSGKRGNMYDGCKIDCPWHQAEWDLETGHSPVVKTRIPTYDIEVVDGSVIVHL